MANDLNQCQFIGRVGKKETRYTADGKAICNISLAVNENWKDKQGQKQEKVTWVPVVIFGKLAEVAEKWVEKGQQLYIQGKFSVRKWVKEGQDRYTTEVVIDGFNGQMQMLGLSTASQGKAQGAGGRQQSNTAPNNTPAMDDDFDDDIPF